MTKCPIHGTPLVHLLFRSVCDHCDPPTSIYGKTIKVSPPGDEWTGYLWYSEGNIQDLAGTSKKPPGLWLSIGQIYRTIDEAKRNDRGIGKLYKITAKWDLFNSRVNINKIAVIEPEHFEVAIKDFMFSLADGYAVISDLD
jgi:hypothetical protein